MKKITIAGSCYNEEKNIEELYKRLNKEIEKFKGKYEFDFIFVDNGSKDNTKNILKKLAEKDKRVKVIINSRNFGHIKSPFYALINSNSDATYLTATDLQDPPEKLPELIKEWENGNDVVFLQKTNSEENALMFFFRKIYYKTLKKITDNNVELAENCTGSGLFDKKIIDILKQSDDPYPYLRGLLCEIGYRRSYVKFKQPTRKEGSTSNNFYRLYDIGMLGVVKYSKKPLRYMAFFGFITSIFTFILSVGYLVLKLLFWNAFSFGIAPIIVSILFLSSIQLFCFGILGEYIGAIYTRVDKKPLVLEEERINF